MPTIPPDGGVDSPESFFPQQVAVPPALTPQPNQLPRSICVYGPAGGSACCEELSPKHNAAPSTVRAQGGYALKFVYASAVAWRYWPVPTGGRWLWLLSPQHEMVPPLRTAHACTRPTPRSIA